MISIIRKLLKHDIGKTRKIKVLKNFITWQIKVLFNNKEYIYDWIDDTKFIAKRHMHGITGNIYVGLLESMEEVFTLKVLRKEDTFYDIGANVGAYSIISGGVIGARTISFEPIPNTYEFLKKIYN